MMHPIGVPVRDDFDRLVSSLLGGGGSPVRLALAAEQTLPAVNLWEDGERVHVEASVPGMAREDIEVSFADGQLVLRGEKRSSEEKEGKNYILRERSSRSFVRVLPIPVEVNPNTIEANLKDGVLSVTLNKADEVKPRKINVKVG